MIVVAILCYCCCLESADYLFTHIYFTSFLYTHQFALLFFSLYCCFCCFVFLLCPQYFTLSLSLLYGSFLLCIMSAYMPLHLSSLVMLSPHYTIKKRKKERQRCHMLYVTLDTNTVLLYVKPLLLLDRRHAIYHHTLGRHDDTIVWLSIKNDGGVMKVLCRGSIVWSLKRNGLLCEVKRCDGELFNWQTAYATSACTNDTQDII